MGEKFGSEKAKLKSNNYNAAANILSQVQNKALVYGFRSFFKHTTLFFSTVLNAG